MKVIKGLIKFIFDTIMVLAICLLIFSIGGKTVFNDLLYSNLFKTMIVDETKTVVGNDVSSEEVEKVLDNEETKKLLENFVDTTMNDLGSDEEVDTDIGEEFLEYLKENKDKFEEELGITITDEQIDQVKSSPEYTEAVKKYEETITTSRNSMSEKDIGAIKLYNYIDSEYTIVPSDSSLLKAAELLADDEFDDI